MSAPRTVVTALLGNEECVTVATLQEQARLLPGEENLLAMYITSAREMVEQYTGRAIRQKRYTASFDCQGADLPWWDGVVEAARGALTFPEIELPWIPLVSVQEVRTYDLVDTEQVADVASYRVDTSSDAMVGRVILRAGYTWPPVGRSRNGVEVDYTAGYDGTILTIPQPLVLAIAMLATHFYTNRGDCATPDQCLAKCGAMPLVAAYARTRVTA